MTASLPVLCLSPPLPPPPPLPPQVGKASYRVDLSLPSLSRVAAHGFASFGRITPPLPLAAAPSPQNKTPGHTKPPPPDAPADAVLFAWAFPLAGARGTDLVPQTVEERAVVNGSFVFFNAFSEVSGGRGGLILRRGGGSSTPARERGGTELV